MKQQKFNFDNFIFVFGFAIWCFLTIRNEVLWFFCSRVYLPNLIVKAIVIVLKQCFMNTNPLEKLTEIKPKY